MYLSRIELNITKRQTLAALSNPNFFHGAIESAFPGERVRKLWRIDKLKEKTYLLLVSPEKPPATALIEQFGTGAPWETIDYDQVVSQINNGDVWRFRLTANPTRRYPGSKARCAIIGEDNLRKWFTERTLSHGFSVSPVIPNTCSIDSPCKGDSLKITEIKKISFFKRRENMYVTVNTVTYEGILCVTDAEKFKQTLFNGIGREKAYGIGLLTIRRV